MRKVMFVLSLLACSCVNAEITPHNVCETVYDESHAIMELRQMNFSITKLLAAYPNSKPARELILSAYAKPLYNTSTHKQRAIESFANSATLECLKNPQVWFK